MTCTIKSQPKILTAKCQVIQGIAAEVAQFLTDTVTWEYHMMQVGWEFYTVFNQFERNNLFHYRCKQV